MAGYKKQKSQSRPQSTDNSGRVRYSGLVTLGLGLLATVSLAQNMAGDQPRLPRDKMQSGAYPSAGAHSSASAHPPATRSPVNPPPRSPVSPPQLGATSAPVIRIPAHTSPQPGAYPNPRGPAGYSSFQGPAGYPPPGQQDAGASLATRRHTAIQGVPGIPRTHDAPGDRPGRERVPFAARMPAATDAEYWPSGRHRVLESTWATPNHGTVHAVRYGTAVTGVVEHPIKSGYLSRTYVRGGHVLYARVYRQNSYQRFGQVFHYESVVPSVSFDTAYYAWAAQRWAQPVSFRWRWRSEPWYAAYGGHFTPYQSYTSLDEWLTDYLIAQNLKNAYQTWEAENAPEVGPVSSPAPAAGARSPATAADGAVPDAGQRPYWESPDDGRRPYWEEDSDENSRAEPKKSNTSDSRGGSRGRPTPEASPPPIPADIKAGINAQVKQQLVERQAHATVSDTDALPNSLRPGHTLFRVNAPLDVPSEAPGRYCSLGASDYIERTGEMDENGTVPVQVKLSSISDCHSGLATHVSVNDLEAMDNEQQEALTNALLAASKSMGTNGLPQGPATAPLLVAAGHTPPAPDATMMLSRLR